MGKIGNLANTGAASGGVSVLLCDGFGSAGVTGPLYNVEEFNMPEM